MGGMEKVLATGVSGVVAIGIITALFLPGRQTVGFTKAASSAAQGVLGTAIKG